ncbi:MAG: RNA ligase (ATP) [Saprospiraceae bacterium]|nr:RNA ligase (ATP) [Saprospiraceae bacterium]
MRQLASIQRIKALEPIENADAILKATILGWQLVVKKGEFQVGDLCVYCEIDSLLPDREEFEFLRPRKMRIRTVRLRGQISQGICFSLSILPEGVYIQEGADVTEALGVTKYEPPMPANLLGIALGPFPSFIPKTDDTRVQVLQELLDKFVGEPCYIVEKLDGSSVTYYLKEGHFGVCSRNLELLENPNNSIWQIARAMDLENKLAGLGRDYALQGEIVGEGIQKNKYHLRGQKVYFFNVFDIDAYRYLDFPEFRAMLEHLELSPTPVLEADYLLSNDIPLLVEKSIGKSVLNAEIQREGIVIRPLMERQDTIGRVSFKAINPEFLLKYDD